MGQDQSKLCETLKQDIRSLNKSVILPSVGDVNPYLRMIFIGKPGSGKTSIITSINAALSGNFTQVVGTKDPRHMFKEYEVELSSPDGSSLTDAEDNYLNLTLCKFDSIFGSEHDDAALTGLQELLKSTKLQRQPAHQQQSPIKMKPQAEIRMGNYGMLGMVCFVADATNPPAANRLKKLKMLKELVDQAGLPKALFISKVDKVDQSVAKNIWKLPKSQVIEKVCTMLSNELGIIRSRVFPIKNFSDEQSVAPVMAFQFLHTMKFLLQDLVNVQKQLSRQFIARSRAELASPKEERTDVSGRVPTRQSEDENVVVLRKTQEEIVIEEKEMKNTETDEEVDTKKKVGVFKVQPSVYGTEIFSSQRMVEDYGLDLNDTSLPQDEMDDPETGHDFEEFDVEESYRQGTSHVKTVIQRFEGRGLPEFKIHKQLSKWNYT